MRKGEVFMGKDEVFMGLIDEQIRPKGFDIIWKLCADVVDSKIKDTVNKYEINKKLKKYLLHELNKNWFVSSQEEIDFEGLVDYIRNDLLDDVEICLCGQTEERKYARENILRKAVTYAKANTALSTKRAQKMVSDIIKILKDFWFSQVPKGLRMMSGEIVDEITKNTIEQCRQLSNKIINSEKEMTQKIDNMATLGLDKNISLGRF